VWYEGVTNDIINFFINPKIFIIMVQISVEAMNVVAMVCLGVMLLILVFAIVYGLCSVLSDKARADAWMKEHAKR